MHWSFPVEVFHFIMSSVLVLLGFLLAGLSISFEKNWVPMFGLYNNTAFFIVLGFVISIHFMLIFILPLISASLSKSVKDKLNATVPIITFFVFVFALGAIFMGVEQHRVNRIVFKEEFTKNHNKFLDDAQAAQKIQKLQLLLRCCGYDGPNDWQLTYKEGINPQSAGSRFLPSSCCGHELHKDFPMDVCRKEEIQYTSGCTRLVHFDQYDPVHGLILFILGCIILDFIAQGALFYAKTSTKAIIKANKIEPKSIEQPPSANNQ